MRFSCQVQVVNYVSVPYIQPRAKRSTITLGGYGGSNAGGKLWILHQNAQNGSGIRYKVNPNIVSMCITFLHEGELTLRLKVPTVDMRISGEPAEVTKFAEMIGQFTTGKPLSAVGPPPVTERLAILDKKELQLIKNGYPTSLRELEISTVGMKIVDPKIFLLPHLQILRLECNQILNIPKSIELLSGLTQLSLKGNYLGRSAHEKDWEWLRCKPIQASLKVLDLSSNELKRLPDSLAHLQALTTLKLDYNLLVALPNNLGFARKLRTLSIKKNALCYIPVSVLHSNIEAMDISENHFFDKPSRIQEFLASHPVNRNPSISLKDLAAKAVLRHRLEYNETSLPLELIRLLDGACYCMCGKATFPSYPTCFINISARVLSPRFTYDQPTGVILGVRFCSNGTNMCKNGPRVVLGNIVFLSYEEIFEALREEGIQTENDVVSIMDNRRIYKRLRC